MLLDGPDSIGVHEFLSDYWQKKPLLIRGALPGFTDPVSPEELAGLACEEDVESRIVYSTNDTWSMKPGPFTERDFTFLPEHDWTLLVQSVDHWLPDVKALLETVPFIPAWRLDDVMISYAAKNGGVGPHFDYYDVFLVQGMGSRRWRTGAVCDSRTPVQTGSGLRILDSFVTAQEWVLESGDVLYVPAGLSHWGTAETAGLCYSIGFRAPDAGELLAAISHHAGEPAGSDRRYRDPLLAAEARPGEIDNRALRQATAMLQAAIADEAMLLSSFGTLMTEPRLPELLEPPDRTMSPVDLAQALQKGMLLERHPASRLACHHDGADLHLFVNGEHLYIPDTPALLDALNDELQSALARPLDLKRFQRNEACLNLLSSLYNQGCLVRTA